MKKLSMALVPVLLLGACNNLAVQDQNAGSLVDLGPDLGDNGQVIIPTGILRVESITPGQRPLGRIVKQLERTGRDG